MNGATPYHTLHDDFLDETPLRLLLAALRASVQGYDERPFAFERHAAAVQAALLRAIPCQCAALARGEKTASAPSLRFELRQIEPSDMPLPLAEATDAAGRAPRFALFLYDGRIAFDGGTLRLTSPVAPDAAALVRPRCNRAVFTRSDVRIELLPVARREAEQDLFVLCGSAEP